MSARNIRTSEVEDLLEVLAAMDDKDTLFSLLEDLFTAREIYRCAIEKLSNI